MKWCVLALGLLLCGCNTLSTNGGVGGAACGVAIASAGTHGCSVTLY